MACSGSRSQHRLRSSSNSRSLCSQVRHEATHPPDLRPLSGSSAQGGILPLPISLPNSRAISADNLVGGAEEESPAVITLLSHIVQAAHKKLFDNKVVLTFESEFDTRRTLGWLAAFNQESSISLTLSDVLKNSVFVAQFNTALGLKSRDTLLLRSPLKALDCFASVNPYGPHFDPCLTPDFKHLFTVHIEQGSPQFFVYLTFMVTPIGRLTRSKLAPGSEYHRISAVVETTLKRLPALYRWRDELIYQIPATRHLRFRELPATDQRTWCTQCDQQEMEDIIHCIWNCPISREVWKWVNFIVCTAAPMSDRYPLLQLVQGFVAVEFQGNLGIPKRLWDTLRAVTAWCIWKARCKHFMDATCSNSSSIIHTIWARFGIYLRKDWNGYLHKIRLGQLTRAEAINHMIRSYGNCTNVWEIHEDKLQIPPVPPRPP